MPLDLTGKSDDGRFRRRPPPDYLARRTQYRIFALIASLFLILFLMEHARQPENWRWIWTIGGGQVPGEEDVDTRLRAPDQPAPGNDHSEPLVMTAEAEALPPSSPPSVPTATAAPPDAAAALLRARHDLWSRLLEALGDQPRTMFLGGLKAGRDGHCLPASDLPAWANAVDQLQAGWQDYVHTAILAVGDDSGQLTDAEKQSWLQVIDSLQQDWRDRVQPLLQALGTGQPPGQPQRTAAAEVQSTLDQVFLDSIRDNTVFRNAEKDAWFRLLEQLDERALASLQRESTGYVGFLQLYKQPTAYRGKLVTVAGTIHMGYHVDAPQNLYGIAGYYVFWLRPAGAKSPIVVYCLGIPDGFPDVAKAPAGERPQLDEPAEFTGYFFKRWAYRARDDTRLAPLILAKSPRWERRPEAESAANSAPSPWFWLAVLGGTGAFGVGFAAIFFWLTRRTPPPGLPLQMEFLERTDVQP